MNEQEANYVMYVPFMIIYWCKTSHYVQYVVCIIVMIRNPLWMLVNTTIFTEGVEEPRVMVETMIEMLNTLLQVHTSYTSSIL